ncbi:hypothetical protein [Nicoliella lavandulae]|uniref:Bacterial Pleckstrin homology domain-containing protein n=1 Tax=Nicoliella lavandulae TaxID=3082954 RepID=A0ABU8SK91_9LACO
MENKVELTNDQLIILPQGVNKLAALKSKIVIPLRNVAGASIDTGILNESKGFKNLGTALPNYWAGSFVKDGEKTFFNIKRGNKPLVIQLKNEHYQRLVLGVDNPEHLVDAINDAI